MSFALAFFMESGERPNGDSPRSILPGSQAAPVGLRMFGSLNESSFSRASRSRSRRLAQSHDLGKVVVDANQPVLRDGESDGFLLAKRPPIVEARFANPVQVVVKCDARVVAGEPPTPSTSGKLASLFSANFACLLRVGWPTHWPCHYATPARIEVIIALPEYSINVVFTCSMSGPGLTRAEAHRCQLFLKCETLCR